MKFYLSGGWDACAKGKERETEKERKRKREKDGKKAGAEGTKRWIENGRICPYDGARFAARKDFESKIDYYEVM